MKIKIIILLILSCLYFPSVSGQFISMVADLDTTHTFVYEPSDLYVFRDKIYYRYDSTFYSFDGTHSATVAYNGKPQYSCTVLNNKVFFTTFSSYPDKPGSVLWKYNGSGAPVKIAEYEYASYGHNPENLVWFQNKLLFTIGDSLYAYDDVNPPRFIENIRIRTNYSGISEFVEFNNKLYFVSGGNDVYTYDGINHPVINKLMGKIWNGALMLFNNKLYYETYDSLNCLKAFDGINAPVVISEIAGNYIVGYSTVFQNKLYFEEADNSGNHHMWIYDGSNPPSIADDIFGESPHNTGHFNDLLYFSNGSGFWQYDGITTTPIEGHKDGAFYVFIEFRHKLYFGTYVSHIGGHFWMYDGVHPFGRAWLGANNGSAPYAKTVFNGNLYFMAGDGYHGNDLWKYDGYNPPEIVADINDSNRTMHLIASDNKLFLLNPEKVCAFDGIHPLVEKIINVQIFSSTPYVILNDKLYFYSRNGSLTKLVEFDGRNDPDILPGNVTELRFLTIYNKSIYFNAYDSIHGNELWNLNKDNSIALVDDIAKGTYSSDPGNLTVFNNKLYFAANDESGKGYLWEYNETGPPKKSNFTTGIEKSWITRIIVYNEKLYCNVNWDQIWSYNEQSGSALLLNNPSLAYGGLFGVINNKLYFLSWNDHNRQVLWEYDGIHPPRGFVDTPFQEISNLTSFDHDLMFAGSPNYYNNYLWEYDGTNSPFIIRDKDFWYYNYHNDLDIIPFNGKLYFTAYTESKGNELLAYTPPDSAIGATACNSYCFNGSTLTSSGIYYDTIPGVAGKDSIIRLHLKILRATTSDITLTSCENIVSPSGRYTWTESGRYADTIPNAAGCDSIITVNLTVHQPTSGILNETACGSFNFNGKSITYSGTYFDTIPNSTGCDSVITLNLTVHHSSESTLFKRACGEFNFNGTMLGFPGIYKDTIPNSVGCDSSIILNLQIDHVDTAVYQDRYVLVSNDENANHQWIDCDNGNVPIPGETYLHYTARSNGRYAVIVSNGACVDTSAIYTVIGTRTNVPTGSGITFYPNPTTGNFTIDLGRVYPEATLTITRYDGQVIRKEKILNEQFIHMDLDVPPGIYMVNTTAGNENAEFKLLKE